MSRRAPLGRVVALFALLGASSLCAQTSGASIGASVVLERFDDAATWRAVPSDGVSLGLHADSGVVGRALRLDFDFHGRAGYGVARHQFSLPPLPVNWAIDLRVRGEALPNTLELKLVDSSGLNVWWMRRFALHVTPQWTTLRFRPSDLSFAWGPLGGGPPRGIAAIEMTVTAGAGGKGWLALDQLELRPLPAPVADSVRPRIAASSGTPRPGLLAPDFASPSRYGTPMDSAIRWRSGADGAQSVTLDFRGPRALGAIELEWSNADFARNYDIERSDDGRAWTPVHEVRGATGGRHLVSLPQLETAWLRLALRRSSRGRGFALRHIRLLGAAAVPTRSALLERVAESSAPGDWPRSLHQQQQYWTVLGVPRDERDALLSEDGALESRPGSFSLEPFLFSAGRLLGWTNGTALHSLHGGWRPIPSVRRTTSDLTLDVTAFATGEPMHSIVWARYRVVNRSAQRRPVVLYLAVRPVQVNPPWQFLGIPGGAASIGRLAWDGRALVVNDTDSVVPVTPARAAGASTYAAGSIVESLHRGILPTMTHVQDADSLASGALAWPLEIAARDSTDVWVALPAHRADVEHDVAAGPRALVAAEQLWDRELGAFQIALPGTGEPMARTVRTALTHLLINARGPALQPGTRSYRRSWIRDGALTSAALLRLGHATDVHAFLEWFLPYQFADGKAPCCVDARGADPVPENDSDGELLYLAAEYWRMTGDVSTVSRLWPALARTASHLDSLRQSRRTARYETPDSLFAFGLLPPSISHEGYSAKPAYSYWDDWWGVRGAADAATLARVAGDTVRARALQLSALDFRRDVVASLARAMALHHMSVLPGAAELGDFDPTSTTMALEPAQALSDLPAAAVRATFDSAWANFTARRDGRAPWEIYTPYEWRLVGSFIRLGQPERAHALAEWFMATRRPAEWNQWSEAIWREPRTPKFIGDMPHGWVASDFIRSTLDMLAYERERDSVLVVGAGIPIAWARTAGGVTMRGMHSWWGTLDLRVARAGDVVRVTVGGVHPPGGIEVHAPFDARATGVRVDGHPATLIDGGRAVLIRAPAVVEFTY